MARLPIGLVLGVVATVGVVAAVVTGLSLIDGPQTRRETMLDQGRIADLKGLAGVIDCYWTLEHGSGLPQDIDALVARMDSGWRETDLPRICRVRGLTDPETAEPYGYRMLGGADYELCATFSRPSQDDDAEITGKNTRWRHEAGEFCFALMAEEIELDDANSPLNQFEIQPLSLEGERAPKIDPGA